MSKQDIGVILAALEPVASGAALTATEIDDFKGFVESADTPARIILPSNEGDTHSLEPRGVGRTARMDWIIKDLLLYRPAEEGMGWLEVGYALDDYCDSYAEKLIVANRDTAGLCSIPAELINAEFLVGVHTFTKRRYYGVMVTLTIREFMK